MLQLLELHDVKQLEAIVESHVLILLIWRNVVHNRIVLLHLRLLELLNQEAPRERRGESWCQHSLHFHQLRLVVLQEVERLLYRDLRKRRRYFIAHQHLELGDLLQRAHEVELGGPLHVIVHCYPRNGIFQPPNIRQIALV